MIYHNNILLKNGQACKIRNAEGSDAQEVLDNYKLTHGQTDFLSSYADEKFVTAEQEKEYLSLKKENPRAAFLVAEINNRIIGTAMIDCIRDAEKIRHRCTFGVSIERAWWGNGVGRALTQACIDCAQAAGYGQMELAVVSENARAISLYESVGFIEYGRNPKAFRLRDGSWQENILMLLDLDRES